MVILPDCLTAGARRDTPLWLARSHGRFFGAQGQFRVAVSRFQAGMAEPATDDVDIDAGFKQMYCNGMPE